MARTKAQIRASMLVETTDSSAESPIEDPEIATATTTATTTAENPDISNQPEHDSRPLDTYVPSKDDLSQAASSTQPKSEEPWYIDGMAILEDCVVYIDNTGLRLNSEDKSKNVDAAQSEQHGDTEDNDLLMRKRLSDLRVSIDSLHMNNMSFFNNDHTLKLESTRAGDEATDPVIAVH
ncbi:hypothetical protein J3B02_004705, partial [Coemansia erecta]